MRPWKVALVCAPRNQRHKLSAAAWTTAVDCCGVAEIFWCADRVSMMQHAHLGCLLAEDASVVGPIALSNKQIAILTRTPLSDAGQVNTVLGLSPES